MSEFMMESYLEYTMGANYKPAADAVTPGEAPASFLETETSTEAKFVPTMLQFAGQSYYAQKLYRMYFLYYHGFLPNLVYASDIMTVTAMWQMYYILAPMM